MKKFLALFLALTLCFGLLACGGKGEQENEDTTTKVEDDGIMKILMIGHSLGNDSTYMLPDIARKNGVTNLVMGVLYHSGCRLNQHVDYINNNAAQYAYYEFDISTEQECWMRADSTGNFHAFHSGDGNDTLIEDGTIAQTMAFGIQRHDWDIVVMQAGVFEAAGVIDSSYKLNIAGDIKTIQNYVLENDIEKGTAPKFAWNITWTCPSDDMLNDSYNKWLYTYFGSADEMYDAITRTAKDVAVPAYNWDYVLPSGTALQNARSSKYEPKDLYRDTIHASDFGRAIIGYTWFCTLFGKTIEECNIASIDSELLIDNLMRNTGKDLELTQEQKDILVESVKNAMANPYAVTPSQYQ